MINFLHSPTSAAPIPVTLELARGHSRTLRGAPRAGATTFYPADDEKLFAYTGRWQRAGVARADWPCSGVQFRVRTTENATITLRLNLLRVRVNVVVTNAATGIVESATIFEGSAIWDFSGSYEVEIPKGLYTLSLAKMTEAFPYRNGVGKAFKSVIEFHGVEINNSTTNILSVESSLLHRRVALIGSSDTAGFCVDGTLETSNALSYIQGWMYSNCVMTGHASLGRRLDAEISVQAITGIGLTQNAFADVPFLLGQLTMPDYYERVLQTEEEPLWNFQQWRPDLVVLSLGGNDFNHQKNVPSNHTFRQAYHDFLQEIAEPYIDDVPPLTIVSVCGQGDPTEVNRDPNNDRCQPCPHVQEATQTFSSDNENVRAEYIFIPCDGSVITGEDDIGCDGHKNALGQKRVADFLEPRLRKIMGWEEDQDKSSFYINDESFAIAQAKVRESMVSTSFTWSSSNNNSAPLVVLSFVLMVAAVIVRRC